MPLKKANKSTSKLRKNYQVTQRNQPNKKASVVHHHKQNLLTQSVG